MPDDQASLPPGQPDTGAGVPGGPPPGGGGPEADLPDVQGGPILAALQRRSQGPGVTAPGMGNSADAMLKLKQALDIIRVALAGLPAGSQPYRDAINAMNRLSRHLPQGAPTAGAEATGFVDMLRQTLRGALMPQIMKMMQGGPGAGGGPGGGSGGPSGGPGGPPGGAPPMPSTPLPGS